MEIADVTKSASSLSLSHALSPLSPSLSFSPSVENPRRACADLFHRTCARTVVDGVRARRNTQLAAG